MVEDIMKKQLEALLEGINDEIAILANSTAFIYEYIEDVNWVGFYINKNNKLILGPFQGRPACVYIDMGKGACGTSAVKQEVVILGDVRLVENYIACHEETNSEIVIPIIINNKTYAVLDIDSLSKNRFDEKTKLLLLELSTVITNELSKIQ